MTLRVNDQDLVEFAAANDLVAAEVATSVQPDPELLAAMAAGYGPVGADFTAAVGEFQQAMLASGTGVSQGYERYAEKLRAAGARYVGGDQDGAQSING